MWHVAQYTMVDGTFDYFAKFICLDTGGGYQMLSVNTCRSV
jgi:hypothetical protein